MIINLKFVIIFVILKFKCVHGQSSVGDPCILELFGSPGVCKLLTQCQQARDNVVVLQKLPQTCSFQETQPIVCCPTEGKRKPGVISKIKCKKYSSETSTPNECGHKIVKRIVGGETASRKEFAHMAAIGFESKSGEIKWLCGGSVISERYILTAAQCLRNLEDEEPKYVQVGVSNLSDTNHRQRFNIAQVIRHPDYKLDSHYHDIGLIKLNETINFNSYVRPACLYTEEEIRNEKAIATGWGRTYFASGDSNDLLKVTLNFVSHGFCNTSYSKVSSKKLKNGIRDEIQLCAWSRGEEKNICLGDFGGPLQIYHEGGNILCMYDIVGIASFVKSCSDEPSVYTRIYHYVKWIEDIIWPGYDELDHLMELVFGRK